jgi:hypothetical protein
MDQNNTIKKTDDQSDINKTDIILTDDAIEELLPTEEELALEKDPMTEAQAEEEVGADEPVEEGGQVNFNEEDEEDDKQKSIS